MALPVRVGGEVDATCSKCKMILAHTILAMVGPIPARVRCNTCQGEHNFRTPQKPKGKRTVREKPVVTTWEALLANKDLTRARRYSVKERFAVDEVLQHPTFGFGLVQKVNGVKATVAFKADVKILIMGQ